MAGITIDRIRKMFGSATALSDISLQVADGEFLALLGPSGCGKTTLLRIIAGLETKTEGRVLIGDRDVSALAPKDRGLAMVFQNYAVFPHMTVFENVAFGLRMQKIAETSIRREVERAASLLHIEPYLKRYPAKLSGGQRQRVAVARALAVRPSVLLMDEPLSNLDALLRLEMRSELKGVLAQSGTTTIYVTHDQTEAMGLADRIAVMHGGVIEQIGAPQSIYERPATKFVGGFVGSPPMNFIRMPVAAGQATMGGFSAPCAGKNDEILCGIRPEDMRIAPRGSGLDFKVSVAEPLGSTLLLTGKVEDQLIRVAARPDAGLKAGDIVGLEPEAQRIVWLDTETGRAIGA